MNANDLAAFDSLAKAQEEGIDVTILNPATDEPIGVVIRVAGVDSERAQRARAGMLDRRIRKRKRRFTARELEDEERNVLGAMTISWQTTKEDGSTVDAVIIDGKEIACTPENAAMVYDRFPFIRRQVDSEAGDVAVFMKS